MSLVSKPKMETMEDEETEKDKKDDKKENDTISKPKEEKKKEDTEKKPDIDNKKKTVEKEDDSAADSSKKENGEKSEADKNKEKETTPLPNTNTESSKKETSKPPFRPFLPDASDNKAKDDNLKKDGAVNSTNSSSVSSPNKISPRPTPPSTPPVRNDKHYPLKKRGLESPIPFATPATAVPNTVKNEPKKAKLDSEASPVSEALTDPVGSVTGNGKGADNNSPNIGSSGIVGEEITDCFVISGN